MHFDYVSGQGVNKTAAVLGNAELNALLRHKCNLSVDAEAGRKAKLSPEKQMMRLRMLAPLVTVNSAQVSWCTLCHLRLRHIKQECWVVVAQTHGQGTDLPGRTDI